MNYSMCVYVYYSIIDAYMSVYPLCKLGYILYGPSAQKAKEKVFQENIF